MKNHVYEYRKFVLAGIALIIVLSYIVRLAFLQLSDGEYKTRADDNAFFNNVIFPSRGVIYDRNGKLLVYNQPAYDIMVVMREVKNLDTLDFCNTLGIPRKQFDERMNTIKDRNKNPGYSPYTQQLFMAQMALNEFSVFQEKLFRFHGFYVNALSAVMPQTIVLTFWAMWQRSLRKKLITMTTMTLATISASRGLKGVTKKNCVE